MAVTIKIDASSVFKKLKIYQKEVLDNARDEMLATALEVETDAKATDRMPIDTGRLKASIHTITSPSDDFNYKDDKGNNYNGSIDGLPLSIKSFNIAVGTNVEYAIFQEAKNGFLISAVKKNEPGYLKRMDKILKRK